MDTLIALENKFSNEEERYRWFLEVEMLLIMCYEEADWIQKMVPDDLINFNSFFKQLQDGVVLCKLANKIQQYINHSPCNVNMHSQAFLKYKSHSACEQDASKYRARDNVSLFLLWLEKLRLARSVRFESDDCVNSTQMGRRQIIICLWYLSKKCRDFGTPLPNMISYQSQKGNARDDKTTYLEYRADGLCPIDMQKLLSEQFPEQDLSAYFLRTAQDQDMLSKLMEARRSSDKPEEEALPSGSENENASPTRKVEPELPAYVKAIEPSEDEIEIKSLQLGPESVNPDGSETEWKNGLPEKCTLNDWDLDRAKTLPYNAETLPDEKIFAQKVRTKSREKEKKGTLIISRRNVKFHMSIFPTYVMVISGGGYCHLHDFIERKIKLFTKSRIDPRPISFILQSKDISADRVRELNDTILAYKNYYEKLYPLSC